MVYWLFSGALLLVGLLLFVRSRATGSSTQRLAGLACAVAGVLLFGYQFSGPIAEFLSRGL